MTLAEQFNHNFDTGDFRLFDSRGNKLYYENITGFFSKAEFDKNNNMVFWEDSNENWTISEFDNNNVRVNHKTSRDSKHDITNSEFKKMSSRKFARTLLGLNIPFTEEEWYGFKNLLEKIQPGITDSLSNKVDPEMYESPISLAQMLETNDVISPPTWHKPRYAD